MYSIITIAHDILKKQGSMSAMKLQKLCYYAQAWSLVWDERPLFNEEIQAWAFGPVCSELYEKHRGEYVVDANKIRPAKFKIKDDNGNIVEGDDPFSSCDDIIYDIDDVAIETIKSVLEHYGDMSAHKLSVLTHSESPWKDARGDTPVTEPSNAIITHEKMAEYYASL